ncbi:phospholipase/carboxylesterase [Candidatus Xenohaliotis californiensis]|uniref:Phospholipase/carboxylesterase n=1 Tax=Candidatus Xenohaliotis californiensis TaxID=84677 RepID=A0ABP0EVN1_9RICK|nr:phospholipase/carboxylesterase [Candidatus Xenohaliotis californiensis]
MKIVDFAQLKKTVNVKFLAVLLHGYGSNAQDVINLSNKIFSPILNKCVCIAPNSPIKCSMSHIPKDGLQWFDLYTDGKTISNSMDLATSSLNVFIDQQLAKFSIDNKNLFIFGFSQGAILAIEAILQRPKPCCAAICFAGALLFPDKLTTKIKSRSSFCLLHGQEDDVIPAYATQNISQKFLEYNIKHETHFIPNLGHHINSDGIKIMSSYIADTSNKV